MPLRRYACFCVIYPTDPAFDRMTDYLRMEYGIDQVLKTYADGLVFLTGLVVRSVT